MFRILATIPTRSSATSSTVAIAMSFLSVCGARTAFGIINPGLCTRSATLTQSLFWFTYHKNATRIRFNSTTATSPIPLPPSSTVNPPTSTLPPPLNTPTRSPSQSAPSHYFALGKSYLKFYKTGLGAVWSNYKAAQPIRARLSATNTPLYSLSRADFQLLRRSRADARRIPFFLLLFMICGEFTPLAVVFAGAVVPRVCKIPAQVESERRQMEERRRRSFREGTLEPGKKGGEWQGVEALSREQTLHVGRSLGLYGRWWDYLGGFPTALLRRRIRSWIQYLDMDDGLIEKAGGVQGLTEEEARVACEERGLDALGRSEGEIKTTLRSWFEGRKQVPPTRLLLSRPNVWHEGE